MVRTKKVSGATGTVTDAERAEAEAMTQQTTLGSICPLSHEQCRFLSMEWTAKIFTKLKKDATTGMFVPDKMGSRKVLLGAYCNTAPIGKSAWVSDLKSCPVVEGANAPAVKIPVSRRKR